MDEDVLKRLSMKRCKMRKTVVTAKERSKPVQSKAPNHFKIKKRDQAGSCVVA